MASLKRGHRVISTPSCEHGMRLKIFCPWTIWSTGHNPWEERASLQASVNGRMSRLFTLCTMIKSTRHSYGVSVRSCSLVSKTWTRFETFSVQKYVNLTAAIRLSLEIVVNYMLSRHRYHFTLHLVNHIRLFSSSQPLLASSPGYGFPNTPSSTQS